MIEYIKLITQTSSRIWFSYLPNMV